MSETSTKTVEPKPFRWGFASAGLTILALMVLGQVLGTLLEGFGPSAAPGHALTFGERIAGMQAKDWLLVACLGSGATFAWLQRATILRFFRSMHVGVMLVALSLASVMTGVLVPQIEGFEDPTERVPSIRDIPDATFSAYLAGPDESSTLQSRQRAQVEGLLNGLDADQRLRLRKYRDEYGKFRWAEGYFVYHLLHPYGIGMPSATLPPKATEGLQRFAQKYGKEEGQNREKTMNATFSGGAISQEIEGLIQRHDGLLRASFDVCTALHLNRAYKSHWFATLLGLLFLGVGLNVLRYDLATLFSMRKVGFLVVHLGIMTLLAGGAYSKWKTDRGILNLDTREGPKDVYWGFMNPEKPRRMPFAVKADRFARRDWKTIEVGFNDEQFTSMPPQYTLWPGLVKDLDFAPDETGAMKPQLRLKVLAISERAVVEPPSFSESLGAVPDVADPYTIGPMASLTVATDSEEGIQLAPRFPSRRVLYDPQWRFRLSASYGEDLEAVKKSLMDADDGHIGWLSMRVAAQGDVMPTRVPIRVGQHLKGPAGYEIEIVRAAPDFRLDHQSTTEIIDARPLDQQYPANPAVHVRIHPTSGGPDEDRPVLERFDYEESGMQKELKYKDLVLNLEWDRWASPGPDRYALVWDQGGRAQLVSPRGEALPVQLEKPLALPGSTRVVLKQLFSNARFERRIKLDNAAPVIQGPHFDATFYSTDPTGVQIEVTLRPGAKDEHKEVVTMASTDQTMSNLWMSPDKRFWLRYFHNDRAFPFEWRTVLSVWEKDQGGKLAQKDVGPEWDREIRVNDYFYYRGYRFFQTNADPQFPTYSGIGVVYDPGIPVVLMGMYLTIVGAILAFLMRPLTEFLQKRKKSEVLA